MSLQTVITNAGIQAIINAGTTGPLINVTSFKVGNTLLTPAANITDIDPIQVVFNSAVNSGGSLQYKIIDANTIAYTVTLGTSVGNFSVGSIGLYLSNGTLFSITSFNTVGAKIADDFPATAGNRKVYNINITFSGLSALTNIDLTLNDYGDLPPLATEADLPLPAVAENNVYVLENHTLYNTPVIAYLKSGVWYFAPLTRSADGGGIPVTLAQLETGVVAGKAVYYNFSTGKFTLATNAVEASARVVGVYDGFNKIITNGNLYRSASTPYTANRDYYLSTSGDLTLTANKYFVGFSLSTSVLLVRPSINSTREMFQGIVNVGDLDDFKAVVNPEQHTDDLLYFMSGYKNANSGFGVGTFRYDKTSTATPDDAYVIKPTTSGAGRFVRFSNGIVISAAEFGMEGGYTYGSGTRSGVDEGGRLQAAVDYVAANGGGEVFIPAGAYGIGYNNRQLLTSSTPVIGTNETKSLGTGVYRITLTGTATVTIGAPVSSTVVASGNTVSFTFTLSTTSSVNFAYSGSNIDLVLLERRGVRLPANVILRGSGKTTTILVTIGDDYRCIDSDIASYTPGYTGVENMTIHGHNDVNTGLGGDVDRCAILPPVDQSWFKSVIITRSRQMGAGSRAIRTYAVDCDIERNNRDGLNLTDSRIVTVRNCYVDRNGDDGIAVHASSAISAVTPYLEQSIISNNSLLRGLGYKILCMDNSVFTGNTARFYLGYGCAGGQDGTEGAKDSLGVVIANNSFRDGFNTRIFPSSGNNLLSPTTPILASSQAISLAAGTYRIAISGNFAVEVSGTGITTTTVTATPSTGVQYFNFSVSSTTTVTFAFTGTSVTTAALNVLRGIVGAGIFITGPSSYAGGGTYEMASGIPPASFDFANDVYEKPNPHWNFGGGATTANIRPRSGNWSMLIANNVVINGLSQADGGVLSGFGFNKIWTTAQETLDPPISSNIPSLTGEHSFNGIQLEGAYHNLSVKDCSFNGVSVGLFWQDFGTQNWNRNIQIQGNHFFRCNRGINLSFTATTAYNLGMMIQGNHFDIDPYFENADYSASTGSWSNTGTQSGAGIELNKSHGVTVFGNEFRNCKKPVHTSSSKFNFFDNVLYGDPVNNKGIGIFLSPNKNRIVYMDSDPTSATYNTIFSETSVDADVSYSTFTGYGSGNYFVQGQRLFLTNPQVYNNKTVIGYVRLTTGNAHVLGTDWLELVGFHNIQQALRVPCVRAIGNSGATSFTAGQTILFDVEVLDNLTAYNLATGVFTVPAGQAGVYRVEWKLIAVNGSNLIDIEVNGTPQSQSYGTNTPGLNNITFEGSSLISLAVADTVELVVNAGTIDVDERCYVLINKVSD
jgi:hypothetical protein